MRNQLFGIGLFAVICLMSGCKEFVGSKDGAVQDLQIHPKARKVYQTEELLRNGNFRQKQFSVDLPLFWLPAYNSTIPEKRKQCSLADGILTMKAPSSLCQHNDITTETATEYIFSFKSQVSAGSLLCMVSYRAYNGDPNSPRSGLLNQKISAGNDFETHEYTIKLDPKFTSGFLEVAFSVAGDQGEIKLSEVSLRPIPPKSLPQAPEVYLDAGDKTVLRGLALSDSHSFYELLAAKYLQKYLFVGFGRHLDILIGDKISFENEKGLLLIGNDFIGASTQAEIKTGGYAILSGNGNIRIGGKVDGAVQGAFAVLSNLGMDFYTRLDFSRPSSDVIKFAARTLENPAFGYRYISGGGASSLVVSSSALGDSCIQLMNHTWYLGSWNGPPEHPMGTLLDPFLYFNDHPEYYALNPTLKCRTWKSVANHYKSKTPEVEYCMTMQVCYSNPDVQRIVVENVLKWFEVCPEMEVCQLLFGDRFGPTNWCQCEECRKFGATDTDRWQRFVNIVACEVNKKYPGKSIFIQSYAETKSRLENEKPASNVIVSYTVSQDGWACKNHFDCQKNRDAGWKKDVGGWLEDYPDGQRGLTLYATAQPAGIIHQWAAKMKYFLGHGVSTWVNSYGSGDYLDQYVLCKLAWDPHRNVDELVAKFTNFYYGPAAPYMKQYVDMIEKCDEARVSHDKNLPPSLVDYEFLDKGEKLLGQAIALTDDPRKKGALQRDLLQLLTLYVSSNNKSTGLRGEKLQAFAKTFSKFLEMCREFKIKEPVWNTSYRQFIKKTAMLDIGDAEPWHSSPLVQKIFADPVGMIAKEEKAYVATPEGLDFKLELFCGGEPLSDEAAPSGDKRTFARVLRRASSPVSGISAIFDLEQVPDKGIVLEIEGLDCEKPDCANLLVKINDKFVAHQRPNGFIKKDWSTIKIPVSTEVLKAGGNSLSISNTTPDKVDEHLDETVGGTTERNYFWGWIMISKVKLILHSK